MLSVETSTSLAAKLAIRATPIFQSKPSGRMTGSIVWPRRPAKLLLSCCDSGGGWSAEALEAVDSGAATAADLGKYIRAQRMIEIARITVPALFKKSHARVIMF